MSDTIAAIATPRGVGAIGIVRLSGPETGAILDRVFFPRSGRSMAEASPRAMVYGQIRDGKSRLLDDALCVLFPAPHSYTGEDCAELHCHGSPIVLDEVLCALFDAGARQAQAGEFTKRAFLNGRMDLLQAEAVADLIDAETAEGARLAATQLSGSLSRTVDSIYGDLMAIVSRFYAVVDYPDEDIADADRALLSDTLRRSDEQLHILLDSFARGRVVKHGVPTVLLGKPNVGKSSLLNALAGYDRTIVTDVAGTTRDTVEEKVRLGHVLLRLTDTAGIRAADDAVESLGVARSRAAAGAAELALLVLDGSAPLTAEDEEAIAAATAPRQLVLINKSDLPVQLDIDALCLRFGAVYPVSAVTGAGLDELCRAIEDLYPAGSGQGQLLTNARQYDAVRRAAEAVRCARAALEEGLTPDAVLTDAETALTALGELNGKSVRNDLVETIFARFCVGK